MLATLLVSGSSEEAIRQIARSEKQLHSFRAYHEAATPSRRGRGASLRPRRAE